ncbi:MAG: hypothetical protein ACYDAB_11675 [bacterium]
MLRRAGAAALVLGCCAFAGPPDGAAARFVHHAPAPVHGGSTGGPDAVGGAAARPAGSGPAAFQPAVGLRRAEIVLRHEGRRVASVRADRVSVSPDMRYAVLSPRVEGEVYEDGRVSLRVRCDEMVIDRETNDLIMRGQMEAVSGNGDRAAAPEARWDGRTKQLSFPGGLRLAARGSTLVAGRATARADLRVLDLAGDVTVTFPILGVRP